MLVLFGGPAGAGKSTLAHAWCAARPRAAHVELDAVRHSLVGGQADPQDAGEVQTEQYALSVRVCVATARAFLAGGYDVAVDDVLEPEAFERYWRPALAGLAWRLVVVLPSLDEVLARSRAREKRVREEHSRAQHAACAAWAAEHRFDTTGLSVAETLALVQERLAAPPQGTRPPPAFEDAVALAAAAHAGQTYPSPEGEPYLLHPLRIAQGLGDPAARVVAVLHDVVEDTPTTLDALRWSGYPEAVVAAVDGLTRRPDEEYAAYVERLAADPLARPVKLADLADNIATNQRLPRTPDVHARIVRYRRAQARLLADGAGAPTALRTERLVLRDWEEADLDALVELKSDPAVLRYTHEEPLDRAGALEWLLGAIVHNRVRPRRAWNLAVVLAATGEVVGWLGFGEPSRPSAPGEYSLGYQLLRRHWGRGYATEAARRIVRFAFEELGAHRVYAECDPENAASARVLEKAGLRREALFRHRDLKRGEWRDAAQYALLADAWRHDDSPDGGASAAYAVRAATPDDLPAVAELSRRWEAEGITVGYQADSADALRTRLGPHFLVGERDGAVVGYAVGRLRESEGLAVIPAGLAYLEVEDLYVDPVHRGRGFGGTLLRRLVDAARAAGVDRALVYSSNRAWERTARFYEAHGFRMWFIRMAR